jgi:hypothetical protein
LFGVLVPDDHKLWREWLRKIDTLLEDEAMIETAAQAMKHGGPRVGVAVASGCAEVVLRLLILNISLIRATTTWSRTSAPIWSNARSRASTPECPTQSDLKIGGALGLRSSSSSVGRSWRS